MRVHAALEIQHIQARLGHFHRAGLSALLLQFVIRFGLLLELFQPNLLLGGIHARQAHIALHLAILFAEIGQLQLPFLAALALPQTDRQDGQRGDGEHHRGDLGQKQAINRYKLHRFRLYLQVVSMLISILANRSGCCRG